MKKDRTKKDMTEQSKENRFMEKFNKFLNLIFPPDIKCIFCGRDINHFYERPFCDKCASHLPYNIGNRCHICDEPIGNEAIVCDRCQTTKHYFKRAYCPFTYDNMVRASLLSYKMEGKKYLALPFALLIEKYMHDSITNFDVIAYVPMTTISEKARSFNQSKLLAEELSKLTHLPVVHCLKKNFDTKQQKELNYKGRAENLKDAFSVVDKTSIKNKRVLLIDDIITTCATVDECSKAMSKYALSISVCAVARNKLHKSLIDNI